MSNERDLPGGVERAETRPPRKKLFYGWWLLVFSSLITVIGLGIPYYSFTVFFLPLKRDLALSSAAVSLVFGAGRLEGGAEGPLVGYLIDRLGPRKLIIGGSILAGIGFILLSRTNSFVSLFLVYLLVVSLGCNAGFFHPASAVVNNWFIRRRGTAMGILTAAGALGGVIMPPLMSYLVLTFDWRIASIIAGLIIISVCVPAAFAIFPSPEVRGLLPDGESPSHRAAAKTARPDNIILGDVDFTVKEAVRTPTFWLLTTCISLRVMVTMALIAHFVPLIVWRGMNEGSAAYLVSLFALFSIPVTLALGWFGDRWSKPLLCIAGNVVSMASMIWLVFSTSKLALYFFPLALAVTQGTAALNWAMIADFFGRARYATLRGLMAVIYGTTTFFSPVYAGWVFDRTGSYDGVLITFTIALVVASIIFAVLRRPVPGGKALRDQPDTGTT